MIYTHVFKPLEIKLVVYMILVLYHIFFYFKLEVQIDEDGQRLTVAREHDKLEMSYSASDIAIKIVGRTYKVKF